MSQRLLFPPSVNNLSKQLNANYTAGDSVITLTNTTSVQNKGGVCLINRVDTNGIRQAVSSWTYIKFTGTSGATLTGCTAISGDQDQALGKVVEFVSDVTQQQAILDALSNLVDPATGVVDTTKIVTPDATQTLTGKTITAPIVDKQTSTSAFTQFYGVKDLGTVGATETVNWANGDRQKMTLDENLAITFSNPAEGQTLTLYMLQDGSGTNTITFADTITWSDATTPTWTTTADKMNIAVITYVGSAYYGVGNKFA